jgi:hypothetical protein
MKKSRLLMLALLSLSLVFLSSCKEDPEEELSPYIGEYTIIKATLTENLTLFINESEIPMTLVAGMDITPMIQTALLGAVDCEPENSLIELREDFSLYISCASSMEELDGGTWEEQSETVIILNLNDTAIPASPTGITLTVNNVTLVGDLLTGETTVPISRDMLAAVIDGMSGGQASLDEDKTPPAVPITFEIELEKQQEQ